MLAGRRRPSGFLSPNGMIASEINANGTPITVRDMFEKAQNPLGVFVSRGNILKNISRSGSSSSSIILSDKESGEVTTKREEDERDDVERTSSPYGKERGCFNHRGVSSGNIYWSSLTYLIICVIRKWVDILRISYMNQHTYVGWIPTSKCNIIQKLSKIYPCWSSLTIRYEITYFLCTIYYHLQFT